VMVGDQRDLLTANIQLREQRDEARAGSAAARAELETVSARARKLEVESQCLYELLCQAKHDADVFAAGAAARVALAAEVRG
jgi:hypothetical protein